MKSKIVEYKQPESKSSSVMEPTVEYQSNYVSQQKHLFISEDDLNSNCMPLAESKRLLLERIHNDFLK